jgi:sec-independent protein translocase protein TatA
MGSGLVSPAHVVILTIIALLVFGPSRLPEIGRSLGDGLRDFQAGLRGEDADDEDERRGDG